MKVLLYGGSFDPPHNGHLNNLRAAAARVRPDRIVVMPAGTSPFKRGTNASGALRLEMCGCFSALAEEGGFPALTVSGWEVQQAALGRRNYTVLTLEMLAAGFPGAELYLAIGSDMLLSFDGWYRWQDILRLARILFAPVEALPMASSALRARLAAGERCENELPPLVRRVIQREGLYRETKGDEDQNDSETGKRACAQPPERSAL